MLTYLDLAELKTKTISSDEEIITKGVHVNISQDSSISTLNLLIKDAVKNLVADLDCNKIYNFAFDVLGDVGEEEFESVAHIILSAFFDVLIGKSGEGRPRERRLDVPDNLKAEVNCNMSLLKRAINYKIAVDRFQLTIGCRSLQYVLVGGYDE